MENFFQILIYLIIIIVFLNSIFKKKDKEKPKVTLPRKTGTYNPLEQKTYDKNQQDDYDILQEIEGLFKNKTTIPVEKRKLESTIEAATKRKVSTSEHIEDKEEHEFDKSWHEITPFKRTVKIDSTIEKEAEQFEHILENLDKAEDSSFIELRNKLSSSELLKDYIVMMEILGKPKYLRR